MMKDCLSFLYFFVVATSIDCVLKAVAEAAHKLQPMGLHMTSDQPQESPLGQKQQKHSLSGTTDSTVNETSKPKSNAVEITSDNYPDPYSAGIKLWSLNAENVTGFKLVIGAFDIASNEDFLKIHPNESDSAQENSGIILTGRLKAPLKMRYLCTNYLRIEFNSNSVNGHKHRGFKLIYIPIAATQEPTTRPPFEVSLAPENPPNYSIVLAVQEKLQNNDTWYLLRQLLCDATNKYVEKYNLSLETCQHHHVTLIAVSACSRFWPNSDNCIEITFCIRLLKEVEILSLTTENPLIGSEFNFAKEMTAEHLRSMWEEFGHTLFKSHNFPRYIPPGTNGLILFWSGMTVAVLIVFMMFLMLISRLGIINGCLRWSVVDEDTQNIMEKPQHIDITMFPSPHQPVPTLFPTSINPYSPGSSFLYGGDVYDNRSRGALEFFNETNPRLLPTLRRDSSFGVVEERASTLDLNGDDKLPSLL